MYEVSLGQCNLNVALDYHLSQGVTTEHFSMPSIPIVMLRSCALRRTLRRRISSRGCPSNLNAGPILWILLSNHPINVDHHRGDGDTKRIISMRA